MPVFAHGQGAYPAGDVLFPWAARTATPSPVTFGTLGARGLIVVINVTAVSATPSVVFTIRGVTPNGVEYNILASAAITSVGTTRLQVHPDLAAAANAKANDLLPDRIKVTAVHADADPITYSVSAVLTP